MMHDDAASGLRLLPDGSVQVAITSPPYFGLRSYLDKKDPGKGREIGLEDTPDRYVDALMAVFSEVHRVLVKDGTLWINLGDSYASQIHPSNRGTCKSKDMIGIPWMVAFALRAQGWYLRSDIVWHKTSPMPESVTDRPTRSYEHLFLLSKRSSYYYDVDAIRENAVQAGRVRKDRIGGNKYGEGVKHSDGSVFTGSDTRNKRDVWILKPEFYKGAHCAVMPTSLALPCVLAGSREGDTVLDPFMGVGTTGIAALDNGRDFVGIDLDARNLDMARLRFDEFGIGYNKKNI